MREILIGLFYQLCNIFEAGVYTYFLVSLFPFKTGVKREKLNTVFCVALLYLTFVVGEQLEFDHLLITTIRISILLMFTFIFLDGNKLYQFIWVLIDFFIVPLVNVALLQFMLLVLEISYIQYTESNSLYYIVGMALSKFLQFLIVRRLLLAARKRNLLLSGVYGFVISVIIGYSIFMEAILFYAISNHVLREYERELLFIATGLIGITIVLVIMMFKVSVKKQQEEKMKLLQMQNQFQEQQMREMQNTENRIARLQHDYKNHILNLMELLKKECYKEMGEYLADTNEYYLVNAKEFIDSGNSVLNAIINTRFTLCKERGIDAMCLINGYFEDKHGFELGVILFNLLDNAIEASDFTGEDKELYLELKIVGEYINILVKNRIAQSVLRKNPGLHTTKADRERHGLGVRHVEELVARLDGMIEIYEEDEFFCVYGMIPNASVK